ncbi:hypothetical protein [Vibrio parahaemolyticus]|uniref:hypothetical protein n=1 Tax=Vibrio parahaemolyticus TaxID=670 RepID=UPI001E636825|nr:hypothetical protein [Vibrio parahaemolyticus]MCD2152062.1 hypothetical protein [Vibrio parahaemolyticus]HCJ4668944.1 hypothetical protein [Vibrio parahaemolyticus]
MLSAFTFLIFVVFLVNSFVFGGKYVEKEKIQIELQTLINNGAGLRAIKFHYDNRASTKRDIIFALKQDKELYYPYTVTLSDILEELRTQQFKQGKPDVDSLQKLDQIIDEYSASNPYDKLEAGQRDLFENIRVKLGDEYSNVASDINKLTDELSNKNKLVNEYLSDSQTSLVVSIVSAFIAVILSLVQMWQSRRGRVARDFKGKHESVQRQEYVIRNKDGTRIRRVVYPDGRVRERVTDNDGVSRVSEYRT